MFDADGSSVNFLANSQLRKIAYLTTFFKLAFVLTGVGRPVGSMAPSAYVLQKFSSKEREEVSPH